MGVTTLRPSARRGFDKIPGLKEPDLGDAHPPDFFLCSCHPQGVVEEGRVSPMGRVSSGSGQA